MSALSRGPLFAVPTLTAKTRMDTATPSPVLVRKDSKAQHMTTETALVSYMMSFFVEHTTMK